MKIYMKSLVALLLCCLLVGLPGVPAQASETEPDLTKDSSLTVILRDPVTNKPISGIELTIYKVGTLSKDSQSTDETDEPDEPDESDESDEPAEEGYYVVVCDDPDNPVPLEKIYYELTDQRAAELEAYVKANDTEEDELIELIDQITVGADGTAVFDNLIPGLYLVTQTGDSKKYIMSAFLVMLPVQYGEGMYSVYYYDYNVIAKPKVIETKTIEDPNDPGDSKNPKKTKKSKNSEDPNELWNPEDLNSSNNSDSSVAWQKTENSQDSSKLPQTGQLWWPVTVMSVVGLLCCGAGYWLKRSSDRDAHRK